MLKEIEKLENDYKLLKDKKLNTDPVNRMIELLHNELMYRYNSSEFFEYFLENKINLKFKTIPKFYKDITVVKKSKENVSGRLYTSVVFDPLYSDMENLGLFKGMLKEKEMQVRTFHDFESILNKLFIKRNLEELIDNDLVNFEIQINNFKSSVTIYKSLFEQKDIISLTDYKNNYEIYLKHPDIGEIILKKEIENILKKYYNKTTFVFELKNNLYEISI